MSAGKFDIGTAHLSEIDALLPLLEQLFALEADFVYDSQKQSHGLELLLGRSDAHIAVARDDRRVIGMATAQLVVSTAEGGLALLVEDVVVLPAWQGKGVGAALLRAVGNWATTKGATRMQLLADRDNQSALAFYQACGWQPTKLICLRNFT